MLVTLAAIQRGTFGVDNLEAPRLLLFCAPLDEAAESD
jgi:hypothetical protein